MKTLFILTVLCFTLSSIGHTQGNSRSDVNRDIFAFLGGGEFRTSNGGGIAIIKSDLIQCIATQISAPNGPVQESESCTNSRGLTLTSKNNAELVNAIFNLLPPAKPMHIGGGVAVSSSGEITCALTQTAPPGGPATTAFSCN